MSKESEYKFNLTQIFFSHENIFKLMVFLFFNQLLMLRSNNILLFNLLRLLEIILFKLRLNEVHLLIINLDWYG